MDYRIFLFKTPEDVTPILGSLKSGTSLIVQTYLSRPCLIDGYKFDLRVYVLVTSADPLRVFIYQDGLARFATEPYQDPKEGNLDDVCMHLTNYAINKHSEKFVHATEDGQGSKRSIKSVFRWLAAVKGNSLVSQLWRRIGEVVVKTLLTIQPQLKRNMQACFPLHKSSRKHGTGREGGLNSISRSQCFEILGFDIFVDNKLKPWVLEVNHSPSFTCDSSLDAEIKSGVIGDALRLLDLNPTLSKRFHQEQKAKSKSRLLANNIALRSQPDPRPKSPKEEQVGNDQSTIGSKTDISEEESLGIGHQLNKSIGSDTSSTGTISTAGSKPGTPESLNDRELPEKHLSEQATEALAKYRAEFPAQELSRLEVFEDANMGQYQRIYPPVQTAKLAHYLLLQSEAANIFSETLSTKRRREFLENKKRAEEDQARKLESCRQRQRNKARSLPSLAETTSNGTERRPRSANVLYKYNDSSQLETGRRAEEREPIAAKNKRRTQKQTLKVNVECINDRFFQCFTDPFSPPPRVHDEAHRYHSKQARPTKPVGISLSIATDPRGSVPDLAVHTGI